VHAQSLLRAAPFNLRQQSVAVPDREIGQSFGPTRPKCNSYQLDVVDFDGWSEKS
jgi:hypothetical protein